VCVNSAVHFTDQSANAVSWSWSFPGGTPASSTQQNPVVTYAAPGVYNATLTATNALGTNVKLKSNYVTVYALPGISISAAGGVLTANGTAGTYQWSLNGSPVTGATGSSYTPVQSGTYTVTVTDAHGCSNTSASYTFFRTGINVVNGKILAEVYPNPTSGILNITLAGLKGNAVVIRCYSATGTLVKEIKTKADNGALQYQADLSVLPRGVYELRFATDKGEQFQRSVVLE